MGIYKQLEDMKNLDKRVELLNINTTLKGYKIMIKTKKEYIQELKDIIFDIILDNSNKEYICRAYKDESEIYLLEYIRQ